MFDHFLVTSDGIWGRGKTVDEAVRNGRCMSCGKTAFVRECDALTYVDGDGRIRGNFSEPTKGKLRRRGSTYYVES